MTWIVAGALVVAWFILLIGNVFLGGATHLLLLAAIALAAWQWLGQPRRD